VLLAWVILIPDSRHEYIVSPTADAAAVSVSNCANVAFEERRQAEKYSRERPGTHVFEVSFRMIR
jgi:hypothetical protein